MGEHHGTQIQSQQDCFKIMREDELLQDNKD